IGADGLANDHPVSFPYTDALADLDGELFPPTSSPSGIGSTIHNDLLIGGSLECSSCHDVHNGGAAAAVDDNLLMITQTGSQLCLTCPDQCPPESKSFSRLGASPRWDAPIYLPCQQGCRRKWDRAVTLAGALLGNRLASQPMATSLPVSESLRLGDRDSKVLETRMFTGLFAAITPPAPMAGALDAE